MAQPQQNISLAAPAFQGINTEDSPLTQDVTFASRANNAVIDDFGRLGARKGFLEYQTSFQPGAHSTPAGWSSSNTTFTIGSMAHSEGLDVVCVVTINWADVNGASLGDDTLLCRMVGTELTVISHSANAEAAIQASPEDSRRAQIVAFADSYYVFIAGQSAIEVTGASCELLKDTAGFLAPQDGNPGPNYLTGNDLKGDIACSAYGRLWVSGIDGDYQKIWYSDLEDARVWYDGKAVPTDPLNTAGGIEVSQYWPGGRDQIKAIKAHNNMLIVFGRNSILLYGNPTGDPAAIGGIFLQDTIEGLGTVSRDAIAATGNDMVFVDDSGVRSLGRSIQEQSVAIGDLTANVRTDITRQIQETTNKEDISLSYWHQEALVVCHFPSQRQAFVLDVRKVSSTGGSRVTTWTETTFDRMLHVEDDDFDAILLGGTTGVLQYTGNIDAGGNTYQFSYQSNPLSFGDSVRQKFPKRMDVSILSRTADTEAVARWGFNNELTYSKSLNVEAIIPAYWGEALYANFGDPEAATYGPGATTVKRYRVNTKGSGSLVSVGIDATIDGGVFSLQELNLQLLLGRIY